jgi:hypothetical protein
MTGTADGKANFDVADIYLEHAYLVSLTRSADPRVQVFEVFGRPPPEDVADSDPGPETILRCEAPRTVWDAISGEARAEFNRRLKAEGKPAGRWGTDETAVQRLLGKELLVLLWAVELPDVSPEELGMAIRNWLGLKPEERWWLYTMTAATTGLAHQQGLGWRGALRQALCFGTRSDAFHLGSVTGRGALGPRGNVGLVRAKKKTGKTKKTGEVSLLFASLQIE